MKKIALIAPLLLLTIFVFSCKKKKDKVDPDNTNNTTNPTCTVYLIKDSSVYTGSNAGTRVTHYVYNSNGTLIRLDYYTSGSKTSFDSIFYSPTVSGRIDSLYGYNFSGGVGTANGNTKKYTYSGSNLTKIETNTETYTFTYSGSTLTGATFPLNGNTAVVSSIVFSSGNIVSANLDPDGAGSANSAPVSISYDSKKNFAKDLMVSTDVFQLFSVNNYIEVSSFSVPIITNSLTYDGDLLATKYTTSSLASDTQKGIYSYSTVCK